MRRDEARSAGSAGAGAAVKLARFAPLYVYQFAQMSRADDFLVNSGAW